jgi:hypothetical protein
MSFGFSVGDFIAAIELANKIRKEIVDEYVILNQNSISAKYYIQIGSEVS